MLHFDFAPCPADPDVWLRPAIKSIGLEYYEYVLLYTDDVLVVSNEAEKLLREGIGKYFGLKEESVGKPKIYIRGHMQEVELENGTCAWAFGSS
eukprot:836400-Ditylum_brightwellii.AAC.1